MLQLCRLQRGLRLASHSVLRVRDVQASEEYYVNRLGFKVDFRSPGYFVSVTAREVAVCFCARAIREISEAGYGSTASDVEKVRGVCREWREDPPQANELSVGAGDARMEDPDGNVLRIGSRISKKDELTGPSGVDMNGGALGAAGRGWLEAH